jgi:hypothetical protein
VEVDAASAQLGEIPPHHTESGLEFHPHRHHPIARSVQRGREILLHLYMKI